jgi:hypothetical protein
LIRTQSKSSEAEDRAKKEEENKVDLMLLSENKFMEVEEEALTSLSTLDIVSIIIVLSLVFSTVPVGLYDFVILNICNSNV